ncbi:MAG: TetR/AcrR family transcriptional regulator [Pseudomonadota bacterium]
MPRVKIEGPEPRERIINAARKLFFKHGYDPVSTDMIAKEARVSKSTLYNQVGDKKSVLIAFVHNENERFFDAKFTPPDNFKDYRQSLIDFGVNLLGLLSEKDLRRFDQVMLGQAMINPDISTSFYKEAYELSFKHVANMIGFGQEKGYIKSKEDPAFLSEILGHSMIGTPYHKAMYGFKKSYHEKPRERIEKILKIILGI